jgi:hypothetical protein
MTRLFRLASAAPRDARVEAWFTAGDTPLRGLVRPWFERMIGCGPDVRVTLHDGQPTACVGEAAFGYVDAFRAHADIGFFQGAALADPAGLLEGKGRWMRHVKLRPGAPVDGARLAALIDAAYRDAKARLEAEARPVRTGGERATPGAGAGRPDAG